MRCELFHEAVAEIREVYHLGALSSHNNATMTKPKPKEKVKTHGPKVSNVCLCGFQRFGCNVGMCKQSGVDPVK